MSGRPNSVPTRRRIGVAIRRLAERVALVEWASVRFTKFIDAKPENSYIKKRVQAMRAPFQPAMSFQDVLDVAMSLQEEGLNFWFAGGWGIDVLVGFQSRDHLDLDIVIEDFRRDGLRVCQVLSRLGYVHRETRVGGIWMPSVVALSDWAGRRIELLEIDWERFVGNAGIVANDESGVTADALRQHAFTEAVIFDQKLPCLSRNAQLLFHSHFVLADKQHRDLEILKESAGLGDGV